MKDPGFCKFRARRLRLFAASSRTGLAETGVYRYKNIIGRRLRARTLPNQRTEVKIRCNILNRIARLGMPVSIRIV